MSHNTRNIVSVVVEANKFLDARLDGTKLNPGTKVLDLLPRNCTLAGGVDAAVEYTQNAIENDGSNYEDLEFSYPQTWRDVYYALLAWDDKYAAFANRKVCSQSFGHEGVRSLLNMSKVSEEGTVSAQGYLGFLLELEEFTNGRMHAITPVLTEALDAALQYLKGIKEILRSQCTDENAKTLAQVMLEEVGFDHVLKPFMPIVYGDEAQESFFSLRCKLAALVVSGTMNRDSDEISNVIEEAKQEIKQFVIEKIQVSLNENELDQLDGLINSLADINTEQSTAAARDIRAFCEHHITVYCDINQAEVEGGKAAKLRNAVSACAIVEYSYQCVVWLQEQIKIARENDIGGR
jgi:hypothetical protein